MAANKKNDMSIGVFDSGFGGLTVMRQLMNSLPDEHFIYFGDTARLPYGEKSRETIIRYSIESAIFLMEQNIKMLVIACNTSAAYSLEKLQQIFNIPIIGVIEPGAETAAYVTKNQHIAVLGTRGTIKSGVFEREIKKRLPDSTVLPIACPLFVPLVEEKLIRHPATRLIVKEYLEPLHHQKIDTVLLGCTHYPLLKELIQEELGNKVHIVDSASTCADKVSAVLSQTRLARKSKNTNDHQYFVSDDPKKFQTIGQEFLGASISKVLPVPSFHLTN